MGTVIGKTMKSLSIALLYALLATAAAVPAPRVGDCAAADDYIDEVLANVAKMVIEQGYDPAELPEMRSISPRTLDSSPSTEVPDTIRVTLTGSQPSTEPGRPSSALETPLMSMQT